MSASNRVKTIISGIIKNLHLSEDDDLVMKAMLAAFQAGAEDTKTNHLVMKQSDRLHLLPHWGYDLVINLDNPEDAKILEGRSNTELLRVAIYRKQKRAMLWVALSEDNGKIKARMTTTIPGGKEDHKISQIKPWVERNEINKTSFDQDQK